MQGPSFLADLLELKPIISILKQIAYFVLEKSFELITAFSESKLFFALCL